jgi:hypothetical protein
MSLTAGSLRILVVGAVRRCTVLAGGPTSPKTPAWDRSASQYQCRQPSLSISILTPVGMRGTWPSQGRAMWTSHTQPVPSQREHFTAVLQGEGWSFRLPSSQSWPYPIVSPAAALPFESATGHRAWSSPKPTAQAADLVVRIRIGHPSHSVGSCESGLPTARGGCNRVDGYERHNSGYYGQGDGLSMTPIWGAQPPFSITSGRPSTSRIRDIQRVAVVA